MKARLPVTFLLGIIVCLSGLPLLGQTSGTLDSDGDELPDAEDPHPFAAEPPLTWRIGPMKIGWKADDRSIETMTTLNQQEKAMLKQKEYSFHRKVEAGAELSTEVNASLSFNPIKLARSGAEVNFRSRITASGGFAWNDTEQESASALQRIVDQEQVSRLLSDLHIEFTVHFSNYGTEDYLCEDLIIPLKVGEHVTTSAQPLGADSSPFLNHSFRIPANRDVPTRILFRAYLDTQEARKLLQLVQSGTLAVSLSESPGFIRTTKDGRVMDAIAAQTAIRRKTCEITIESEGTELIYHIARRDEKTGRPLSVEDAFSALNALSPPGEPKLFHLTGKSLLSAFGQNNEANPPRWWVVNAGRNAKLEQDQDVDLSLPLPNSLHLRYRTGFPADLSRWLMRADQSDPLTMLVTARLHYSGLSGVEVDHAKAVGLWQKAEVLGPHAHTCLAIAYMEGIGGLSQDMIEARRHLNKAAELKDVRALTMLGLAHMHGLAGYANDEKWAIELFREAERLGDIHAVSRFVLANKNGQGVLATDEEQALSILKQAAGLDD